MSHEQAKRLAGLRVVVIGAGASGLCTAVRLAQAGSRVRLCDPSDVREEASGVAAGMLAPIGEALFDDPAHLPLWRGAAALWAAFADTVPGLQIVRCGARFAGVPKPPAGLGLTAEAGEFHSGEDARLDPWAALQALEAAFAAAGGERRWTRLDAPPQDSDIVILAAGFASKGFAAFADELSVLTPIKGQLLRFEGGPAEGPILRAPEGYLTPSRLGAAVGATMEPGLSDRTPTEAARTRLLDVAERLSPGLSTRPHRLLAGVRASTPDGLPIVGPSSRKGLFIATGMRRNGWLLGPLVAEIALSYLSGDDGGPHAAALDPRRFDRS
jgi:glycine oxidase